MAAYKVFNQSLHVLLFVCFISLGLKWVLIIIHEQIHLYWDGINAFIFLDDAVGHG